MTAPRSAREQFPALASQAAVYEDTLATLSGEYDQSHVQASNALNLIDRLQTETSLQRWRHTKQSGQTWPT